jgi:hypothetical protein
MARLGIVLAVGLGIVGATLWGASRTVGDGALARGRELYQHRHLTRAQLRVDPGDERSS